MAEGHNGIEGLIHFVDILQGALQRQAHLQQNPEEATAPEKATIKKALGLELIEGVGGAAFYRAVHVVPEAKYKSLKKRVRELEEALKKSTQMAEAMWDAPGMPGANAIEAEMEQELPKKRTKTKK